MSKSFYYTFPGSRGSRRQRRLRNLAVGVAVGLLTAGMLASVVYALQN